MNNLIVRTKDGSYEIVFKDNFLELKKLILELFSKSKFMFVFDSNTGKYFKNDILKLFSDINDRIFSFTFAAGEGSKNLDTVNQLYTKLITHNFERTDIIIAVGGGVVGDLAGFSAATYLRGIRFVQVPTTLLSMTDSSVGGKTGVDFLNYKNMIGAFAQPSLVYMNVSSLNSLPEREYLSGMAEVVKYGYIWDKDFLNYLDFNFEQIIGKDFDVLKNIIYTSCKIKKEVVENDPTEKGFRAILNYGHTVGHAIEKLMNFKMLHGECVALGMISAGYIALKRGLINNTDLLFMKDLLKKFKLYDEKKLNADFTANDVLLTTKSDKKMQDGKIKFILTKTIGHAEIYKDVTDSELIAGIEEVIC